MRKTFLALLMAVFVLSFWIGTADAAWTTGVTTTKKICSYTNSTTLGAQSADAAVAYRLGTGESMSTTDYVTINITGGAKFSTTAPTITTAVSCAQDGATPCGAGAFGIVGSAVGLTTANFQSTGILGVHSSLALNSNAAIFDLSAVTGSVDITIEGKKGGSGLVIFAARAISAAAAYGGATIGRAPFSAPAVCSATEVVAKQDTVDVSATAGPYKGFTGAVTATTGTATTANFQLYPAGATSYCPDAHPLAATKLLWTIAGNFTGISALNASGAGLVTGSDSTGSQTGGTANVFAINAAKTYAYASNTAVVGTALANIDPKPQFVLDGTTAQSARGFTVQIDVLADSTLWAAHTARSTTSLYSMIRNGVSFATNSVGSRNTIKITDRSGNMPTGGGNIIVTAWDVNGNSIPESSSATVLKLLNHETKTVTGTELQARFPTGTPMKYEFAVESSNAVATNVKVSTDGANTSTIVYTNTPGAL